MANHHRHVHHKEDERRPRNLAGPIILIIILMYAARAATHIFPGMDPKKLAAVGYGDTRPISPNDTPAGRKKNRRTEVVLLPIPKPTK